MAKIPLHIPEPLPGSELAHWFKPPKKGVFDEIFPPNFFLEEVERVAPEAARAIVLPHNFSKVDDATRAYIARAAELGAQHHLPVFLFSLGDLTDGLRFDERVYALRLSVYRSQMSARDIVMPTLTEDNGSAGITLRAKEALPTVSFCGMGGFPTWDKWMKYYAKTLSRQAASLLRPLDQARILGVYWRRKMMHACERSSLVATHFIVRKTFSGIAKTIELDPAVARREYLDSIIGSDFVLAPKGDGNYSNRFLKTLCLGRIPVVVDTDAVLPLEDVIDYDRLAIRVPMQEVAKTPELVRSFYDALPVDEWQARQGEARAAFERYLRQDSFLAYFFTEGISNCPPLA